MNWTLEGKYAAHSDCQHYAILWYTIVPPYHARIRGNPREVFGGSLGSHATKAEAKAACVRHAEGEA